VLLDQSHFEFFKWNPLAFTTYYHSNLFWDLPKTL